MSKITTIKPQKSGKRLNIYLDGKFSFGIDLENFVKAGLKIDQELSEEKTKEIIKKAEFQKTLDKLLRFATLRPRSEKEVGDWLRKKKVHESLYNELFNRLEHLKLLDDYAFASWWVEQRIQFRPKSKRAIEFELRQKGIAGEIVREILDEKKIDEEGLARNLLEKKMYKWKNLDKAKSRQKMSQYLSQKGFGWGVVGKTVEKMLE